MPVHSILVTLSPAMGLRTASARDSAEGDGIISSISRLWSRLVDLIRLSTMSTWSRERSISAQCRLLLFPTCRTSVTWLVFLLSSLTSVLLLLFRRRMAAMTTMETTAPVPTSSVNTLSVINWVMLDISLPPRRAKLDLELTGDWSGLGWTLEFDQSVFSVLS